MASRIEAYFCNGIMNTRDQASKTCDHISNLLDGHKVHLHHNDSTSATDIFEEVILTGLGVILLGMGVNGLFKSKDKDKSVMLTVAGCMTLLLAKLKYEAEIDARIGTLAYELAGRVEEDLQANPHKRVLLVLHSQGAEVGKRALDYLDSSLKGRVDVVAIGGKEKIVKDSPGQRVFNIRHERDLVPIFFNKIGKRQGDIVLTGGDCLMCHGASEYLSRAPVKAKLRALVHGDRPLPV